MSAHIIFIKQSIDPRSGYRLSFCGTHKCFEPQIPAAVLRLLLLDGGWPPLNAAVRSLATRETNFDASGG